MKFKLEQDVRIGSTVISEGSIVEVVEEKVASTKYLYSGDFGFEYAWEREDREPITQDVYKTLRDEAMDALIEGLGKGQAQGVMVDTVIDGVQYYGTWTYVV